MSKDVLFGVIAAAISPLAMTFGFILWGKSWKSSAYSLNLFKCTFAATIFMIIAFSIRWTISVTPYEQFMIILSSILGIVIGDNTWLLALQMIGAKRVIIIDTFKPLLAAVLGSWILNEPFTWTIGLGIIMSTIGIVLVSIEKNDDESSEEKPSVTSNNQPNRQTNDHSFQYYCIGYFLAFINVFLDAIGSVLTKQFGTELNTWEINFLRFGFASISMAAIAVSYYYYVQIYSSSPETRTKSALNIEFTAVEIDEEGDEVRGEEPESKEGHNNPNRTWYKFPHYSSMNPSDWNHVIVGICFVTFLCPALSNYALFQIPLGLCLTLTSLGPVYSIPLVYILSSEKTGTQGIVGAVMAVAGVAIMFV
eukprot:gene6149-6616_t